MPVRNDKVIWRGNTAPPLEWTIPDGVPILGSSFVLTIGTDAGVLIAKETTNGTLLFDSENRRLAWTYTAAESRLIPEGQIAQFEIERHSDGAKITEIYGFVSGLGGLNADAEPAGFSLDPSKTDMSSQMMMGWI